MVIEAWHMDGWQWVLLFLAPVIGAGIGGVMGFSKKDQPFNWKRQIVTVTDGAIAGGLWMGAVRFMEPKFGIAALLVGLVLGVGFDFLAKKLPTPS